MMALIFTIVIKSLPFVIILSVLGYGMFRYLQGAKDAPKDKHISERVSSKANLAAELEAKENSLNEEIVVTKEINERKQSLSELEDELKALSEKEEK